MGHSFQFLMQLLISLICGRILEVHLGFLQTVRFKNELERNITIKLGYANAKIYKCEDERCPRLMCYKWVMFSLCTYY